MQLLLLLIVGIIFVSLAFTLLAVLFTLAVLVLTVAAVAVPAYLIGKHWAGKQGLLRPAQPPLERLKAMYVEGKIDLFEFERRAAALLAVER